jgi:hypothetical protein
MASMADLAEALRIALGLEPADLPWIEVNASGVLAAMRTYTKRWLYPVANFRNILENGEMCCRGGRYPRLGEVALSEFPIQSVEAVNWDSNVVDLANVETFSEAGYIRIESFYGFQRLDVEFSAGYVTFPGDLFMAMSDILKVLRGSMPGSTGTAKRVSIVDVGAVDLSTTNSYIDQAITKSIDPLLGPWGITLDGYVDHAKLFWNTRPRYSQFVSLVTP